MDYDNAKPPRSYTFSVELDSGGELVELHLGAAGADFLVAMLQKLRAGGDAHLMTPEWGGTEMSTPTEGTGNVKVHHLKLMVWGG